MGKTRVLTKPSEKNGKNDSQHALRFRDGFVRALGYRIYYKSIGEPSKGTVLCLHGGPGVDHWTEINMADLAPLGYRVVWYDQLGCGRSEKPKCYREYTIERSGDEADAVRRRLHLDRVHLWGHSYGGALALQTILRRPRGFLSITLGTSLVFVGAGATQVNDLQNSLRTLPPQFALALVEMSTRGPLESTRDQIRTPEPYGTGVLTSPCCHIFSSNECDPTCGIFLIGSLIRLPRSLSPKFSNSSAA